MDICYSYVNAAGQNRHCEGFDVGAMESDMPGTTTKLGGVGIQNVDERVKLDYGEQYGVKVHVLVF